MPDPTHIAAACALSPRLQGVLVEARRFASLFDSSFSILHVGERLAAHEKRFRDALEAIGVSGNTPLYWSDGPPAASLVRMVADHNIDLLIAGALEREVGPHFLSGVARALLRDAPCSLLLFTDPQECPRSFRKIVVVTDFSDAAREALRLALHVAEREKVEILHVLSVFTPFTAVRAKLGSEEGEGPARHQHDEEAMLDEFVQVAADSSVLVETRVIHSTTGLGASDFTKSIEADLLVVPATTAPEGHAILPPYMDWVMQVIPCALWVVKH